MLTALKLGNFKAYAETQHIPIRPLTLIYGANSAGKSSIIHSLLLANHALTTGSVNAHRTKLGGESVDLGGFGQFVHRHDTSQSVEFGIEVNHDPITHRDRGLGAFTRSLLRLRIGLGQVRRGKEAPQFGPCVVSAEVVSDDAFLMRLNRDDRGVLIVQDLDFEHSVVRPFIAQLDRLRSFDSPHRQIDRQPKEDRETFEQACQDVLDENEMLDMEGPIPSYEAWQKNERAKEKREQEERARRVNFIPEFQKYFLSSLRSKLHFKDDLLLPRPRFMEKGDESDWEREDLNPWKLLENQEIDNEEFFETAAWILRMQLSDLIMELNEEFENVLGEFAYLGPLRCYPPRHVTGMYEQDSNWFSGGGQAWEVVRKKPDVLQAVNKWLGAEDRLKKPYELVFRELVDIRGIAPMIAAELEAAESQRQNPDTSLLEKVEAAVKKLAESKQASVLSEVVLMDKLSGTEVSHRDIGVGVSQILPVLVSAFASEKQLIAIEQPEIHLHPALHAELGDVFIESALGEKKNTFILESHSEHLLLRIMRRIKETSAGTLPPGMSPIRPKDVAVLFVEPYGSRSIVREMPLNERGELIRDWPGGFFEEGLRELLT